MHLIHHAGGMAFSRKVGLDNLIHDRDKRDDISQGHAARRLNAADRVS
jgi:hypothetical protein